MNPTAKFRRNPPADPHAILRVQRASGVRLPEDYTRFLQEMNGGEGFVGTTYLRLWPVEELLTHNEGYKVAEFAPGLFLFGTDGAGEAYAFDMRVDPSSIIMIPFITLADGDAISVGRNFTEFWAKLIDPQTPIEGSPRPI